MLIFIDIETTGLEDDDKLCSIALLDANNYKYELVNEGKKIPPLASSINHITNEMIKNKVSFKDTEIYEYLYKHNTKENTLVAHNIKFDLDKLESSGLVWVGGTIDTLRVTKHLIPECELFSLQVLRYELKLYRDENKQIKEYGIKDALFAHHALCDVVIVKLLFKYLKDLADEDMMKELSVKNVLLEKFTFGKYKSRYIEEICMNDRAYISWLMNNARDMDEDMRYSVNYYLQG